MKVCGFTFIRNAIKYDYPIFEAISSILPLCDKFIVVVGNSEDNTRNLISRIDQSKIEIIDSVWDENLREGGRVLAVETNKAIDKLPADYDWGFYIQGDEVIHEKYHSDILSTMKKWEDDKSVEGLLFDYQHFYGSYDFIGDSTRWYRKEIRIIRCDKSIRSFRDAQGFRKDGRLLNVKETGATVFHYGWVKSPIHQQAKQKYFHSLWHSDDQLKKFVTEENEFDYAKIDSVKRFTGTHPGVMQNRIASADWKLNFDPSVKKLSFKSRIKVLIEKFTGWRPGEYKNYRIIED
jgi:hypothetical protein